VSARVDRLEAQLTRAQHLLTRERALAAAAQAKVAARETLVGDLERQLRNARSREAEPAPDAAGDGEYEAW